MAFAKLGRRQGHHLGDSVCFEERIFSPEMRAKVSEYSYRRDIVQIKVPCNHELEQQNGSDRMERFAENR